MKKSSAALKLLLHSGDIIGLDLGTHTVKALRLRLQGSSAVVDYELREVWHQLSSAGSEAERAAVYEEALRDIAAARSLRGCAAAVSLPGNSVLLRFLKLPRKHRLDPDTGIPDDARGLIPFELRDAAVDTLELPAPADSALIELLLAVAEKRLVDDTIALARRGGFQPAALVNDALALEAAHALFGPKDTGPVALVNAGASTTSVSIVEDGVTRASRVFNIAGNAFTRAIRRGLDVEPPEAESLKQRLGLAEPADPGESETAAKVQKALKAPVRDLCTELRRTLDHFSDARPARAPRIGRVLLAGGSARLKGLAETMGAEIGLPVEVFRPLESAELRRSSARAEHLSPAFAVVAGLAATNALLQKRHGKSINLIPPSARRAAAVRNMYPARGPLAALAVLALAVVGTHEYARRRTAAHEARAQALLAESRDRAAQAALATTRKTAPAKQRVAPSPFAYLKELAVSGVVGDEGGATFMLASPSGTAYTVRAGRLYDRDEKELEGVSAMIVGEELVLTTIRKDRYVIALPR